MHFSVASANQIKDNGEAFCNRSRNDDAYYYLHLATLQTEI